MPSVRIQWELSGLKIAVETTAAKAILKKIDLRKISALVNLIVLSEEIKITHCTVNF